MRKKHVYLDYASTTPVDVKVQKAMLPFFRSQFGNPSSVHQLGQRSRAAIEKSREQVALFLGCSADEVTFTSGATEANNLAIQGIVHGAKKPHVVTSAIEHESVLSPIQELKQQGKITTTFVTPKRNGIVDPSDVAKAVQKNTVLVSIQYANSEIGTIQPIREIGERLKNQEALFHTDAVQAALYLPCRVEKLGVDLLTISSHKIYGPKGVGVLYTKKGIEISPLVRGGGQEQDRRAGTENVPGIVGMGEAVQELSNPKNAVQMVKVRQLRDWLLKQVPKSIPGAVVTGSRKDRLPNNAHFLIKGVDGKDVVFLLDQKGIAVSTGSACSELTQDPSHVLLSLGYTKEEANSALRMTLGKYTTKEEVQKTVKALKNIVE